jgi:selenocysteine-specific elongation factor
MNHIIIGTAGHVDHGKTSLIKMLTGIDCDTHKEEKQRGITINLGFSHLDLPGGESVGIIDVPGHKDFINTMIGGASSIDLVMLVVAADRGVMPQTTEHVNIVSALGVTKGLVALTKCDMVDEEMAELAEYETMEFLSNTSLKDTPVVRVSAVNGKGKEKLIETIYNIIGTIEPRKASKFFRMYIDRIFTVKGMGSVVTGSVLGGSLSVEQEVFLLPGGKQKLRVRAIERHGKAVDKVVAGDRAAINLIGLKADDYSRGMIICEKKIEPTSMIDAYVQVFPQAEIALSVWSEVTFISGTFECKARMHLLNKDKLEKGQDAIVQIHLKKPASLLTKDKFILRNSSEDMTIAGGYLFDPAPLHHRKRTPQLIEKLTKLCKTILSDNSINEIIGLELKREFRPFSLEEVALKIEIESKDLLKELSKDNAGFSVYARGDTTILIDGNFDGSFRKKIIAAIKEYHAANSLFAKGLETIEIIGKVGLGKTPNGKIYAELLLQAMQEEDLLDSIENTWALKGHQPTIDKKSLFAIQWLEDEILHCGDNKPVFSEIEEKAIQNNIPKAKIRSYLSSLGASGKIVFSGTDFLHSTIYHQNKTLVKGLLKKHPGGLDVLALKDALSCTKRLRAMIVVMLEAEKVVTLETQSSDMAKLILTPKGKNWINDNLS